MKLTESVLSCMRGLAGASLALSVGCGVPAAVSSPPARVEITEAARKPTEGTSVAGTTSIEFAPVGPPVAGTGSDTVAQPVLDETLVSSTPPVQERRRRQRIVRPVQTPDPIQHIARPCGRG